VVDKILTTYHDKDVRETININYFVEHNIGNLIDEFI